MASKIFVLCVVFELLSTVKTMERSSLYVKKSEMDDQAMSGTGFAYSMHYDDPETDHNYETNSDSSGDYYNSEYYPHTLDHTIDDHIIPLSLQYAPYAYMNSYGMPVTFSANDDSYNFQPNADLEPGLERIKFGVPYAHGYHDASNYNFNDKSFDKGHGEHGENRYNKLKTYDKGYKDKQAVSNKKVHFSEEGGNNDKQEENGGHYGNKHEKSIQTKGESHDEKKGHRKGSKTTGYHKVIRKDEYKKDHSFYDEADKRGHFKKYGNYEQQHEGQEGQFAKGGHRDAGYNENDYAIKDTEEQARFVDKERDYKAIKADQAYYRGHEDFGRKDGRLFKKEKGFDESNSNKY